MIGVSTTGCTGDAGAAAIGAGPHCSRPASATEAPRRNIVFVLADDLSENLVPYMPHVLALQRAGTTFRNYTVTDSLCCPSRASILTGEFPHNTHISGNVAPRGGFGKFMTLGEDREAFNVALAHGGYETAMMGKYLNQYSPMGSDGGQSGVVPPGWSEWDVTGGGYREFNYTLNEDHQLVSYGKQPGDYLTDVLSSRADAFIQTCAAQQAPFMLEVATFAPHEPYVPSPADARSFLGLTLPRSRAFDRLPRPAPAWLKNRPPLTPAEISTDNHIFRLRVEADLAVDRLLGSIESTLARTGEAANTDVFFSSDNGYHMGEYRLLPGKRTAYDTDIRVPLVAAGPDIRRDHVTDAVAQNVDLAPTFEALAGVPIGRNVDGRSLVPLLRGERVRRWREFALVEHKHTGLTPADPDSLDGPGTANPPSYEALRTRTFTYVEYVDGSREFYDRVADPAELRDLADYLPSATVTALHAELVRLDHCRGARACWRAARQRRIPMPSWLRQHRPPPAAVRVRAVHARV